MEETKKAKKFVIMPESRFNAWWEGFILLLTICVGIQAPLVIVFNIESKGVMLFFDIAVSFFFAVDIIINFLTAYEKGQGVVDKEIITDLKAIARKYLKGWFWIDLFATIPFDIIFTGITILSFGRLGRMLRLFRLARLFRLIRIAQSMQRVNRRNIFNPSILRMVFLVFWIAFGAHFITSGWILLYGNPDNLDMGTQYLQALYWTITTLTTIGYGDITPSTNTQIIYVIFIELSGAGMYGFIIGNIANLITNIDIAKTQYSEKMEKISTFMKYRNLPFELQHRIINYYNYLWESRRGYDETAVLQDLPVSLKTQVAIYINKEIIEKVPIFNGASDAFVREIILNLDPVVFTPGDIIVNQGDIGYDMFFISKGSVDVVSEDQTVVYATLTSGQFFGEIALLLSSERTATIKAKEYCDLYRLNKDTFDRVLARYPVFEKNIKELAAKRKAELGGDKEDNPEEIEGAADRKEAPEITNLRTCYKDGVIDIEWDKPDIMCHFEVIKKGADGSWRLIESSLVDCFYRDYVDADEERVSYRIRGVYVSGPGRWSKRATVRFKR